MTHTPGPWLLATSNSWRRIVARDGSNVCEPITQNDGHPDLHFRNGGEDGPDAALLVRAPELLAENERQRIALKQIAGLADSHVAALPMIRNLALDALGELAP